MRYYLSPAVRPEIIKRKKERPRRKAIFTIPPAAAGGIIKRKKKPPQKNNLYYPSRVSGRVIYLSPAAAGDIYFVRADRRGLIKRKKERLSGQAISIHPTPARGWDN